MNNVKYNLNLVAAILSIIVGALELIGGVVGVIGVATKFGLFVQYGMMDLAIISIVLSLLDLALGLAFIIIGAKGCKKPVDANGDVVSTKKLDITLLH